MDKLRRRLPDDMFPFADHLDILQEVVTSCVSTFLKTNFEENIVQLKSNYKKLVKYFSVTVTPKLHMIFDHIVPFCKKRGYGLGIFSEQAAESVHFDFHQNAWVNSVNSNHKEMGEHLRKAILS